MNRESRICPPEFQERITRMFGVNQFGEPKFKIVWGQTQLIKLGTDHGYRYRMQCHDMPCWVIMRWKPSSAYGSPDLYYAQSWMSTGKILHQGAEYDAAEGFYVTADYPWKGRYEIVQPLISKEFIGGKLVIDHFPLSHYMIDMIIPMILAYEHLSDEERKLARDATHAAEEAKTTAEIAQRLEENMPRFWETTAFGQQGVRSSILSKKMEQIEKVWNRWAKSHNGRPRFSRGMAQGNRPAVIN